MGKLVKGRLLESFRENAEIFLADVIRRKRDFKERASEINKRIIEYKDAKVAETVNVATDQNWSKRDLLDSILLINYVSYVIMLEYRNKVWNYEYMAFSRRIGELFEPFCKIPFRYPITNIEFFNPPLFAEVIGTRRNQFSELVNGLPISQDEKDELHNHYNQMSGFIDSGAIQLGLDVHFVKGGRYYNVDLKSGFSSNEKGNTNRLLLVASIYKSMLREYNMILLVRQPEEENNHYLQSFIRSPNWEVYCADDAYRKICEFTGFDLRHWINDNMDWRNDISADFRGYLEEHDLIKYLTW